jgi:predicted RNase H-like nuclease (RuvC/YqgF family)
LGFLSSPALLGFFSDVDLKQLQEEILLRDKQIAALSNKTSSQDTEIRLMRKETIRIKSDAADSARSKLGDEDTSDAAERLSKLEAQYEEKAITVKALQTELATMQTLLGKLERTGRGAIVSALSTFLSLPPHRFLCVESKNEQIELQKEANVKAKKEANKIARTLHSKNSEIYDLNAQLCEYQSELDHSRDTGRVERSNSTPLPSPSHSSHPHSHTLLLGDFEPSQHLIVNSK